MKYSTQLFVLTFFFSLKVTSNSKFCNDLPVNQVPFFGIELLPSGTFVNISRFNELNLINAFGYALLLP
jgi:hypothetical protein